MLEVGLRPELDPPDVPQVYGGAVGVLTHHDVAELFGGGEPALRPDRVRELLALRCRLAADLTAGIDRALSVDGVPDVRDGEPERLHLVGPEPDAHRIVRGTEDRRLSDSVTRRSSSLMLMVA